MQSIEEALVAANKEALEEANDEALEEAPKQTIEKALEKTLQNALETPEKPQKRLWRHGEIFPINIAKIYPFTI